MEANLTTPTTTPNKLYNAKEVCAFLGIRSSTLYVWMEAGHFPKPIRLGHRTIRWTADQLQTYVAGEERKASREICVTLAQGGL
jgi:predicted DNA-binding transcriptional regulator AlpA